MRRKLFPKEGQPAEAPWRLALITVMQFVENLSDRQAADAVRGRIDWKYLLSLDLTDSGFDASVLCEFRARLVEQQAEHLLLEKMLTLFGQKGWLKARGRQRTDSTHVLAKIRALNRVLCGCRNHARGAQCSCGCCSRLATCSQSTRVGRTLWPS